MKTFPDYEAIGDTRLVELCLQGNRDAFARIVARYQSAVCAIAYSGCGDVGRSEDIAQETFMTAWQGLAELKEPGKLKSWLCGIARNKASNSLRKQSRVPLGQAVPLEGADATGSPDATPHEQAVSNEEQALMWRAVEAMPPEYREPLVLFYREGQSAEKVAAALGISEEAVRQRLTRGRAMLNDRITKTVEGALLRSAPGKTFTLAVLAALPASLAVSAKAAAMGGTAAKGGAAAKAAVSMGLLGMLLTPLLAFFGTYIGYKLSMETAGSQQSRLYIRKFYRILAALIVSFGAAMAGLAAFGGAIANSNPRLLASMVFGLIATYMLAMGVLSLWAYRSRRRGWKNAGAVPVTSAPGIEYRSRVSLLGLPLVHIRMGFGAGQHRAVKAWIAMGDTAIGVLFAFGGVAIAPVSFGGLGIGLFTFSGFAIGLCSVGGFAFGVWAFGGAAMGLLAFGGCAAAWKAAVGGVAVACDYALGGFAQAAHSNDHEAVTFVRSTRFFPTAMAVANYLWILNLLWIVPLLLFARALKKKRLAGEA